MIFIMELKQDLLLVQDLECDLHINLMVKILLQFVLIDEYFKIDGMIVLI